MKRRTEINIELTRSLHIRRHAAPCECALCAAQSFAPRWTTIHCRPCACALCAAQGEMAAPDEAAVVIDVSTRTISEGSAADQVPFVENADAGEAIELDSAAGQLILAAAVRSLEQRLAPEMRATIAAGQHTLAPHRANRNGFYLKLQSVYQSLRSKVLRFARKEK